MKATTFIFRISFVVLSLFCIDASLTTAFAHSEHDKARFVDSKGKNEGRCDSPLRPCKTIAYAVTHANKGDKVLVAGGEYRLNDIDEVFLLTSEIVPVLGGYNRYDHYLSQAPQLNSTTLIGVPLEFIEPLTKNGFHVVNDGIAQYGIELNTMLKSHKELKNSHSKTECVNGKAGNFNCSNIDLMAHMSLGEFSSAPSAANDIWGHVDLNTGTEYAIIGLKNGISVVSLAEPENPVEVGFISGTSTSWRDIKVYQWFDESSLSWKANAYVGSEGSNYIHIIDLSQLPNSISKLNTDRASLKAHNVYISNVDYTTNTALEGVTPSLHLVGQNIGGGAFRNYSLADPSKLQPIYARSDSSRSFYTHDVTSMVVEDSRAQSSCQSSSCTVLVDFNEKEMRLWNISDPGQADEISNVTYPNAEYVHSGWWSEDKKFVFVHDELDEQRHGLNTTVRIFDVNNLQSPNLVKTWTGPTKAIDHNGFVRGNRYYMSNYQRGVTILDISDATDPKHVGYFDTYPASDSNAFNGVWGVYPYLPSGLIIASDINSGLYILKDKTLTTSSGSASFELNESLIIPGNTATLKIQRPEGSGVVSVAYESISASAESSIDFQSQSGRLRWDEDDNDAKSIELVSLDSGKNKELLALVRLFDPQGGLTLSTPSYHTVKIGVNPIQAGSISFQGDENVITEGGDNLDIQVARISGSQGIVKVSYHLQSGTAIVGEDILEVSGELVWADGDDQVKLITITSLEDEQIEEEEQFTIVLESIDDSEISNGNAVVSVIDNDRANTAPVVSAGDDRSVNAGETVSLVASATDAEGDALTYQWVQVSGDTVELTQSNNATSSFVAPQNSTELIFEVTVTDSLDAMTKARITITVVAIANIAPAVSAGDDIEVFSGEIVTLTASAVDPEGQEISYLWKQESGSHVELNSSNSMVVSFVAPSSSEQLEFSVAVTDSLGATSSDQVTVSTIENQAPQLSVTSVQNVSGGNTVTLSVSATDPENQTLSYQWSQVSGDTVSLSSSDGITTTFAAPNSTIALVFNVTVSDTLDATSVAEITVNVSEVVATTPPTPEPKDKSSSGGAFGWLLMSVLMFVRRKRN